MIVKGWNRGSPNNRTGGGYGIAIVPEDRDKYFRKTWISVIVELDNQKVVGVTVSPSFWEGCPELRSKMIGRWMLDYGLPPWPKGRLPRFQLGPIGDRRFRLSPL